jgi:diguanylate cyclase (GGDEF)-like protein/PAS domain S-box-containing protein
MTLIQNEHENPDKLRINSEAILGKLTAEDSNDPAKFLVHEIMLHKLELEMQNEELRRANFKMEEARDRYLDIYETAPIGYITINRGGLISEINLSGSVLLGSDRNRIINHRFARFIAPKDIDRWHQLFMRMMKAASSEQRQCGLEMFRSDGSLFHAHLDCVWKAYFDGSSTVRVAISDVTKAKMAEKELRIAATAFETQDGIFITDNIGVILNVNQAFSKITGYSAIEAIGQTPRLLNSGRHDATFYTEMWDSVKVCGSWQGEIWNRRKNGEIYPEWQTISAIIGDNGETTHYIASFSDITQQKVSSQQIEQLAFYDSLTNLPNRRLLKDRLHQAVNNSTRNNRQGALLFVDIDNFKTLNDTLGHNIGDLFLQEVANRLQQSIRESDTAARLGGDEFVVMLEDLSPFAENAAIEAEIVGKKILDAFNEPFQLAGYDYRCSCSIGATLFYDHLVPEDELLKHVDIAMYQAKKNGRNTLCFFDQDMQLILNERAALEADLRCALEKNQFELYYQIQVAHDGQRVGVEALLRWQHPEKGLISPMKFIPLAEETGLVLPIGLWALEAACTQLKRWECNPVTEHLQLAVNVSARQLHECDFVEQVNTVLDKTGIKPSRLKLELTESVVIKDAEDSITKMLALKAVGVSFSIDDFGTGFSSLSYLTILPLDQLKIDQSFVRNIGIKHTDSVIIQTIIGMAKNLGIEVIAEGVETVAQRSFLEEHGCLLCQGYLFSEPVPLAEFEMLINKGSL